MSRFTLPLFLSFHDDVIKWKHFPRYWPFVRGIHRSPVNSLHKGQWRGALMLSLICVWINGWVNNREAGNLRRYRAHYDVTVMLYIFLMTHTCVALCHLLFLTRMGEIHFRKSSCVGFLFWESTLILEIQHNTSALYNGIRLCTLVHLKRDILVVCVHTLWLLV